MYNDGIRYDGCPSTPPFLLCLNNASAKAEVEKEPKKKKKNGAEKQDENGTITRRRRGWLLQYRTG